MFPDSFYEHVIENKSIKKSQAQMERRSQRKLVLVCYQAFDVMRIEQQCTTGIPATPWALAAD